MPAPIRDYSGTLTPGAHTARTQPPYLGAPEATLTPWCVCVCASGVTSQCESPAAIYDRSRDGQATARGVLRSATAARPSGGQNRKGETPTGDFGIVSTVSCPSRRAREMVERCCSCTQHSTCSTTVPCARACKCRNTQKQYTGCYCWGKCKNKGRFMPSPSTTRGLLGHFPRGADPPANDPRVTTPPV